MSPPRKPRVKEAERHIGVGDGRVRAATAVAGRTRLGASATRPDFEETERVHRSNRAATRADLDHVDRRDNERHPASFAEAVHAVDLEGAGDERLTILD